MKNLNENAIREAAYYIWKNAGCPSNTSLQDWNAAIQQLSACSCNNKTTSKNTSSVKTSALKSASLKKSASASKKTNKTTAKKSK